MNEIVKLKLSEIIPYEKNPRRNDHAVDDVAESIRQCGYKAKIIVDENNVIIAGHTRWKALNKLGWKECEVQRELDMTEEQKKKYRLLDNKVGEKATWDNELLKWELEDVNFEGFDFGFELEEDDIDVDEFFDSGVQTKEKEPIIGLKVLCGTEQQRDELKAQLEEMGFAPTEL